MSGWSISACVCLLLIPSVFPAEGVFSSHGKRFYLGWAHFRQYILNPSIQDTFRLTVTTTSLENVSVDVTTPLFDHLFRKKFTVSRHHPHTVRLSRALSQKGTLLTNTGILVEASNDVTVLGSLNLNLASDMYLGVPEASLGQEYRALTNRGHPQLLVVGTKPKTTVTIRFKSLPFLGYLSSYFTGNVLTITLDEFQALQVIAMDTTTDFTGTPITADKPIAVFSGSFDSPFTDYTLNMLIPTNRWGTLYNIFYLPTQETHDYVKIIASQNDTNFLLGNGSRYSIAQAGDFWQEEIDNTSYFRVVADKPVMVSMISKSFIYEHDVNRQKTTLAQLVPQNNYVPDYAWDTMKENSAGNFSNFLSIVINKDAANGLILDNASLVPANVEVIEGSQNVHMSMAMTPGSHILKHERHVINFFAHFSGTQIYTSYASIGGFGEGTKYVCEITGDPHVSMFSGQKISLALPCTYLVTRLTVTNFLYIPGVVFYSEIEVVVYASNSRRDVWGRFFLTTVCCTVTFRSGNITGPSNTYCIGERLLSTYNNWWVKSNETLQDRVLFTYDPVNRIGSLEVTNTSVRVTFDLLKRNEGNFQKKTPGLAVEVNTEDLIYDETVRFPNTACSTIDDTTSVKDIIRKYNGIRWSAAGIYAILLQPQIYFPHGFQDLLCPHLRNRFLTCPKSKRFSLRKCVRLMKPESVKCFRKRTQNAVHATRVALECFDVVCSPTPNCTNLVTYINLCPITQNLLNSVIQASCP